MKKRPRGKSMWKFDLRVFLLLKEKDLYEPYQMENINNGIFVLVFLTFGQTLL